MGDQLKALPETSHRSQYYHIEGLKMGLSLSPYFPEQQKKMGSKIQQQKYISNSECEFFQVGSEEELCPPEHNALYLAIAITVILLTCG